MKDLTHYFVSPPKIRENVDDSIVIVESDNESVTTTTTTTTINDNLNKDNEIENVEKTPSTEKRTRVKIRISVNEKSKNRRCDIIENRDDVVDKTPSPFNKINKSQTNDNYEEIEKNPRDQSNNAFKVLMNRNKPNNTPRSSMNDSVITSESRKEYKKKLSVTKEKLLALADKKGEYTKRKHAEIEETEAIENRLKKRARLFKIDEKPEPRIVSEEKPQEKKKETRQSLSKSRNGDTVDDDKQGNDKARKKKKHKSKNNDNRADNGSEEASALPRDNSTPPLSKERSTPTRNKAKWTMRVKLHSQSDDDKAEDTGKASDCDDDYIFTPKSKQKLKKIKTRVDSSDGENKETKKLAKKDQSTREVTLEIESDSIPDRKVGKRASATNRTDKITANSNVEIDVVVVNNNVKEISVDYPKIMEEKKLAPLFVRRCKPNLATLEARRSFLQSGIPESFKKISTSELKSSSNDSGTSAMPFPTISHVSQTEIGESEIENNHETVWKLKSNHNQSFPNLSVDANQFKSLYKTREESTIKTENEKFLKIERENFETVLKDIESRCSDTRSMWKSVTSTSSNPLMKKSPKKRAKKLKLQRKVETVENNNSDSLNPTWTCKYKPMNSTEVVGNETAIVKLRNWLSGWRVPSNRDDRSSGDEFYSSDCSNNSYNENNQVAVLVGPYGSGKTASVYAIAEELGYRVLEVNASSRRTGKKILSDFQEATKSHRVKRDQATLMPIKKKPSDKKVPQNSLILIEDVDLIFDEDEGFVSATFQIAANTRRPIVMTCKDCCSHIYRMAPQLQFIHFQSVSGNRVSALLELIALTESGYRLSKSCLDTLLRNGDLRQSLLQLQYILLSGAPSTSQLGLKSSSTLWEDMQPMIYKPALKTMKKLKKVSRDALERDKQLINTMATKLDNISLVSSLTDVANPVWPPWKKQLNPSLSLLEDFKPYSNSEDLSYEIAEWLRKVSLKSDQANSDSRDAQISIKRKVKLGIDLALSQAVPSTLEHRSKAIDYLPIIRTICRSEQNRATNNTKRGNRFHNYLHGLNLASASNNILAAASSVFQDKSP